MNSLFRRIIGSSLNNQLKNRIRRGVLTVAALITIMTGSAKAFTPEIINFEEGIYNFAATEEYRKMSEDEKTEFVVTSFSKLIKMTIREIEKAGEEDDTEKVTKGINFLFDLAKKVDNEFAYSEVQRLREQYLNSSNKSESSAVNIKVTSSHEEQRTIALGTDKKVFVLNGQKFFVERIKARDSGLARDTCITRIKDRCGKKGLNYNNEFPGERNSKGEFVVWCAVQ